MEIPNSELSRFLEAVDNLQRAVEKLEKIYDIAKFHNLEYYDDTDEKNGIYQTLNKRAALAINDLRIWTGKNLDDLAKDIGIGRVSLWKIRKGTAGVRVCRKVLLYHRKYAKISGRAAIKR